MTPISMAPETWIRSFPQTDDGHAGVSLVCLPHAGGSASVFRPLATALPPEVKVLAVQYPGRQDRYRETTIDSLSELADRVFEVVSSTVGGRIALFGHSMGALVAFEVALRMAGGGPERVFASGRRAPSRYRHEDVHRRSAAEIRTVLEDLGGTGVPLDDPEMLDLVLPAVRGDYKAVETYRYEPGPPLDCPLTVLTGDRDPLVTHDEARDWRLHTRGQVDLRVFTGGHFFVYDNIPAIADLVGRALPDEAPA